MKYDCEFKVCITKLIFTDQPLDDAIMVSAAQHTTGQSSIEEPDDQPLLMDTISFSSSNSASTPKDLKSLQSQVVSADIEKC